MNHEGICQGKQPLREAVAHQPALVLASGSLGGRLTATARSHGTLPLLSFNAQSFNGSGALSIKNCTKPAWPASHAACIAVIPEVVAASMLAPASRSAPPASTCPPIAAQWKGVLPGLSVCHVAWWREHSGRERSQKPEVAERVMGRACESVTDRTQG